MTSSMTSDGEFNDFNTEDIYNRSLEKALDPEASNFVVQFGKDQAEVAFNLSLKGFKTLLDEKVPSERPVRWINIWAPDRQAKIVKLLSDRYDFSPRLLAIMQTTPPGVEELPGRTSRFTGRRLPAKLADPELGEEVAVELEDHKGRSESGTIQSEISHYTLAEEMINYQSIDFGTKYWCIGANWMHRLPKDPTETEISTEGDQFRLWSWLVLCDDNTVISLHEDSRSITNNDNVKLIRTNTLSVLSQLSNLAKDSVDPISMQTVRQALKHRDVSDANQGIEGASLLFYYLFDDWRAVFVTVTMYKKRLGDLRKIILGDAGKRFSTSPRAEIIPRLHVLGYQLRQSQHLYEGYKNLIQRALTAGVAKFNDVYTFGPQRTMSFAGEEPINRGVMLTQSAVQRFERLSDRLELLILGKTKEFLDEKDALISTYFNINAQKDSEATARLTRSATLLAKLSVLFLPVSLMTSYFSIQISELQGKYTTKDYWYSFAVIMCISFLSLFFFSRLLMWVTESLDARIKSSYIATKRYFGQRIARRG